MLLLLLRFVYFTILFVILFFAIRAAVKTRKEKTKRMTLRCIILFTIFIVGLFLSVFSELDMSSRVIEDNIQQAAKIIFEIKENDKLAKGQATAWDYESTVCDGAVLIRKNLSNEAIQKVTSEVSDWSDVSGKDGDVYYYFSPVTATRSSVYLGLPEASWGNITLIKNNDCITINYHYTAVSWFDYMIAPIFSPEYLYREKINIMDIATAEKKNIKTVEIPIEQR